MTVNDIAILAANETKPTERLLLSEWLLWYRLRDLYRSFKKNTVTKEQGEKEKAQILRQFQIDNSDLTESKRIIKHHADMWARIEQASRQYLLNKTSENAELFHTAVYNCKPKEGRLGEQNI